MAIVLAAHERPEDLNRAAMQEAQQCADALCAYVASAASALPPSECEVLYGRAGLLYALLFTERTCPTVTIQQDLFQVWFSSYICLFHVPGHSISNPSTCSFTLR